jgi:hypothetical protein
MHGFAPICEICGFFIFGIWDQAFSFRCGLANRRLIFAPLRLCVRFFCSIVSGVAARSLESMQFKSKRSEWLEIRLIDRREVCAG